MNKPEISIVIPSYNRENLLREMMDALTMQSIAPEKFEVVVVLDGSTDGSMEMLRSLNTPFPIHPIYQDNSGVSVARNTGARAANGDFIVFLDDDVLPAPELVEEHLQTQTSNPNGVVLGLLVPAGEGKRGGWNIWEDTVYAKHYKAVEEGTRPAAGRRLYSGNFSVHRESFLKIGGFNEALKRGEDVELGFRMEREGVPFYFSSKASAVHRGYRNFHSWCNSAYLYGQTDVQLAVKRGHGQVLSEIFRWYQHRASVIHLAVNLTLGRENTRNAIIRALRYASGTLSFVRLNKLAHVGYSIIFNVQYWNGVANELGGRESFQDYVQNRAEVPASTSAS